MKQINIKTILLLLLVGAVIVLWLLIRPAGEEVASTQETPSAEPKFRGRFPDGCPAPWMVNSALGYKNSRSQDLGQEFLGLFDRLRLYDSTQVLRLESRGFCVFQINELVFVLFNNYEDTSGVKISGRQKLLDYLGKVGINTDICEIIWSQCHDEPDEAPEEPEDEEIDGEALVLSQLHGRLLLFFDK